MKGTLNIGLVFLLTFLGLVVGGALTSTVNADTGQTIISKISDVDVNLDGVINEETEWVDVEPINIFVLGTEPAKFYIKYYSSKCFLYAAFVSSDTTTEESNLDYFALYLDMEHDNGEAVNPNDWVFGGFRGPYKSEGRGTEDGTWSFNATYSTWSYKYQSSSTGWSGEFSIYKEIVESQKMGILVELHDSLYTRSSCYPAFQNNFGFKPNNWADVVFVDEASTFLIDTAKEVGEKVEEIRQLEFNQDVPLKTISRNEYLKNVQNNLANVAEEEFEFTQQEFEALYILDESVNIRDLYQSYYGGAIIASYNLDENEITFIGQSEVDEIVLAHELTHALQDQHFMEIFNFETNQTDVEWARTALIEGDASLLMDTYQEQWKLIGRNWGGGPSDLPLGFRAIFSFPYIEGKNFVKELRENGGWKTVDNAYLSIPKSSEQIIHPEKYGVDEPTKVIISDESSGEWEVLGRDELGEFSVFVMFWNRDAIEWGMKDGSITYSSKLSEGWDGDEIIVYKKGKSFGYIWQIVWDDVSEADEFVVGYNAMLRDMGAEYYPREYSETGWNTWVIDLDDCVSILKEDNLVTIVNAPTIAEIWEIRVPDLHLTVEANGGEVSGGGWYANGSTAYATATSPINLKNGKSRRVFTHWSGDSISTSKNINLTMDAPFTITANWKTQYCLTIEDESGTIMGQGWYDEGARIDLTTRSKEGVVEKETRLVFKCWSGDCTSTALKVTLEMDCSKKIKAHWQQEFFLNVYSKLGNPQGEGWYKQDENAVFSVVSPLGMVIQDVLDGWSGDLYIKTVEGIITMDSPKTVKAIWRKDYNQLSIILGIIAIAVIGITFVLRYNRKR